MVGMPRLTPGRGSSGAISTAEVGYHPENQEIPARPHENAAAGPEIVEGQKKGKSLCFF